MKIKGPGHPNLPPAAPTGPAAKATPAAGVVSAASTSASASASAPAWAGPLRTEYRRADLDDPAKAAKLVSAAARNLIAANPSSAALPAADQARIADWMSQDPMFSAALRQSLDRILT
ncbi:MAG: hypothetical protein R2762_28980 [Bryobacteraceae bacterium]